MNQSDKKSESSFILCPHDISSTFLSAQFTVPQFYPNVFH